MEYLSLSNGVKIPPIGLGTDNILFGVKTRKFKNRFLNLLYNVSAGKILYYWYALNFSRSVAIALKEGYRLIDTATSYGNEKWIKLGIKWSRIPREDIFLISRVSNRIQASGNTRDFFMMSLNNLGVKYLDMYMIHWPVHGKYIDTWNEIIKLYHEGYIRSIGVANCHEHHIDELIEKTGVSPMADEIECHPLFQNEIVVNSNKKRSIVNIAYTPLARQDDRLMGRPALREIAKKYNKSVQQVILRWHIQKGIIPIPRSVNPKRVRQNFDIFDFELNSSEIAIINSLNLNSRLRYDPDNCDFSVL